MVDAVSKSASAQVPLAFVAGSRMLRRMKFALVTCSDLPGWEKDDHPLHRELDARGITFDQPCWDGDVDWTVYDAALIFMQEVREWLDPETGEMLDVAFKAVENEDVGITVECEEEDEIRFLPSNLPYPCRPEHSPVHNRNACACLLILEPRQDPGSDIR